jgi:hypothetical protein
VWTTRQFIDAFGLITPHGWLTWDEGLLLATYAAITDGPMVEVGSYLGRSAMLLAQLPEREAPALKRRLYCVDSWTDEFSTDYSGDEMYRQFLANINGLRVKVSGIDIVPVRRRVEEWDGPARGLTAEFVYLDGDHTYEGTLAQLDKARNLQPCYIAAHDVNDSGGGKFVKTACTGALGHWRERLGRLAVWGPLR